MNDPKLPKQWKHWLSSAKLRPYSSKYGQSKNPVFYFIGRGRHWRVNMHGQLQVSERQEEFDRWANSVGYSTNFDSIPKTRDQFNEVVRWLIQRAERRERLIQRICIE